MSRKDKIEKKLNSENPEPVETADSRETAPLHKKRRWHFGDRYEGRRLRTLASMQFMIPYIMKVRSDSQNHFEDRIDMDVLDAYCEKKKREGLTGFGALHAILAAYVRTISERPGINQIGRAHV